jgi:predicted HTH transcriptional regulator
MKTAFDELKRYIERKTEENDSILVLSRIPGINQRQAQIIKIVQERPNVAFSVKEIESRFSVSNQTARTDLYALVKLGYLIEIQMNKRKVAFVKSKEFDDKLVNFS